MSEQDFLNFIIESLKQIQSEMHDLKSDYKNISTAINSILERMGSGDTRFQVLEGAVKEIVTNCHKDGCQSPMIKTLLDHLGRHEGDILEIVRIVNDDYGKNKIRGSKLLPDVLERFADNQDMKDTIKIASINKITTAIITGIIALAGIGIGGVIGYFLNQ